jgi:hypothetical protein
MPSGSAESQIDGFPAPAAGCKKPRSAEKISGAKVTNAIAGPS